MFISVSLTDFGYSSYDDLLLVYKCSWQFHLFSYIIVIVNDRFTYCFSHMMVIIMILSLHLRSDYASSMPLVLPECPVYKL